MKKSVFVLIILISINLKGQELSIPLGNIDLKFEEGKLAKEICKFSCSKEKEEFVNYKRKFSIKIPCFSDVYESKEKEHYFVVFSSIIETGETIITITELPDSEYDVKQQFLNDYFLQAKKNSIFLENGVEKINGRPISWMKDSRYYQEQQLFSVTFYFYNSITEKIFLISFTTFKVPSCKNNGLIFEVLKSLKWIN